jgi:hypothetical protein
MKEAILMLAMVLAGCVSVRDPGYPDRIKKGAEEAYREADKALEPYWVKSNASELDVEEDIQNCQDQSRLACAPPIPTPNTLLCFYQEEQRCLEANGWVKKFRRPEDPIPHHPRERVIQWKPDATLILEMVP